MFESQKERSPIIFQRWVYLLLFFITALVLLWGAFMPENVNTRIFIADEHFPVVWNQVLESGETIELDDLRNYQSVEQGQSLVFQTVLPDNYAGLCLLFYTENQEVEVLVDGVSVYSAEIPEEASILQTPGSLWNDIEVYPSMIGKTLELRLDCEFPEYHGVFHSVEIVHLGAVGDRMIQQVALRGMLAVIMIAVGLISFINGVLWKENLLRDFVVAIGYFYLTIGLWILAELDFFTYITGRSIISYLLSMLLLRLLPVVFCYFISTVIPRRRWWTKMLSYLSTGNFVLSLILQFCFGVSFLRMQNFFASFVAIGAVVYLLGMVYRICKQGTVRRHEYAYYASSIFMFSLFFEMFCYINYRDFGQFLGLGLTVAAVVYSMIAHVLLVGHESRIEVERQQLKISYDKLQAKPLMQQINAHFLFNSLNTISAYCKEDPAKADQAVRKVARFMRSYMHLINQSECVVFSQEIELMNAYFSIQKMRFGDSIDFLVDQEFDDFSLPPLTIQPLVENAVQHGVRRANQHGIIIVRSYRQRNYALITVEDNGVGFDVNTIRPEGIGLKNVEARLHTMGGSMRIESTIRKGTLVTVQIPITSYIGKTGGNKP